MNALTLALACGAALWLGYRIYGRFIGRRVFGAGDYPDDAVPSHAQEDGVDFVPTKRHVLLGHHYVTIAGAGPIVGPAVAATWGWLPALIWIVVGCIFIGAVHDFGALVASVRNRARTVGDLAADIMSPRVRILFLSFIWMALWLVMAVFGFVIANLFTARPESVLAVWIEVPLALMVGYLVTRRGGSMLLWSLVALVLMYVAIGVGIMPSVKSLFTFADPSTGVLFWLIALFAYAYVASVMPVTKLLQPRDYINSHQLFFALGILLVGLVVAAVTGSGRIEMVAPAINANVPYESGAPLLWPFLFITIACGAISGFHCMVASGTTARQIETERDARAIGYGGMILEGALAVIVIICCCSAAGFADLAAWNAKYSTSWAGAGKLLPKLEGFIQGGAGFMNSALPFLSTELLAAVITVVIISFAATTMDSATRIQRYVVTEFAGALNKPKLARKHVATSIAVGSAMLLSLYAATVGKGDLVLWPIFGIMNQMLACMTLLVLNTWLAKRGKPVIYTTIPMLFLIVTVSWAAIAKMQIYLTNPVPNLHLILVLGISLVLEAWMIVEGVAVLRTARRVHRERKADHISRAQAERHLAGPSGATIDEDGVVHEPTEIEKPIPAGSVC